MRKEYFVDLTEEEADELMDEHWVGELVRCKDCKHIEHVYALDELNGKKCYVCRKHPFTGLRDEDWFCADGEPGEKLDTHKHTLTVHHINHIPEDCRPENLIALCAPCHLKADAKHHAETRAKRREEGKDMIT